MRCRELMERLEALTPASFAENWDNVGLLVGRLEKEIGSVLLAVDVTQDVIRQAEAKGADLILSHHPMVFSALKRVTDEDFNGSRILRLAQDDICCYAMHTNFDVLGMADAVADEMNLADREVLEVTCEDEIAPEGIGRVGSLPRQMTLRECALFIKETFQLPQVRIFGEADRVIERAAVVPGSGKYYVKHALRAGADVLITGDIGHHDGLDAMEQGLAVLDAGHFGLEKIFMPYMEAVLARELPELKVMMAVQDAPFWTL